MKKHISWTDLDAGLSVQDKIIIFEEFYHRGNLTESLDKDKKDYFLSLSNMSDTPVKNQKFIVVPLAFVGDRIMALDKPDYLEFLETTANGMIFKKDTEMITYPSRTIKEISVFNTFTFLTTNTYNKFRTSMILKFNFNLPDVIISKDNLSEEMANILNLAGLKK